MAHKDIEKIEETLRAQREEADRALKEERESLAAQKVSHEARKSSVDARAAGR